MSCDFESFRYRMLEACEDIVHEHELESELLIDAEDTWSAEVKSMMLGVRNRCDLISTATTAEELGCAVAEFWRKCDVLMKAGGIE
jgi:hypothetical protein